MTSLARVVEILANHINFTDTGEQAEIDEYLELEKMDAATLPDGDDPADRDSADTEEPLKF